MRLPPFLPRAHGAGEVGPSVGRKLLVLALFPFLLCVFTGTVGTRLQRHHDEHLRRAGERAGGASPDGLSSLHLDPSAADPWGMAFAFGLCASSVVSIFALFVRNPRRRSLVGRRSTPP